MRRRGYTAPGTVSGTALSNFFLWAWSFHDFDDDDYEEECGETNAGFGGLAVMGVRHMVPDSEPPQTLYKVARPDACVWDGDSSSSPPFDKLLVYGEVSELAEGARLEIA